MGTINTYQDCMHTPAMSGICCVCNLFYFCRVLLLLLFFLPPINHIWWELQLVPGWLLWFRGQSQWIGAEWLGEMLNFWLSTSDCKDWSCLCPEVWLGLPWLPGINHAAISWRWRRNVLRQGFFWWWLQGRVSGSWVRDHKCISVLGAAKTTQGISCNGQMVIPQLLQKSGLYWVWAESLGNKNWRRQSGSSLLVLWTQFWFCLFTCSQQAFLARRLWCTEQV